MKGRPRTPTKVLEMRGAFERNPQRKKEREGEPAIPVGVGEPPSYFDAGQVEAWHYFVERGKVWLTASDEPLLEEVSKLRAEGRRAKLGSADGKRYDALLRDLGYGPVARTRIKVPSGKEKTKLSKFA